MTAATVAVTTLAAPAPVVTVAAADLIATPGLNESVEPSVFVFASENTGGPGLLARGLVTSASALPKVGTARQTPRVSIIVERRADATRPLGRTQLREFVDWTDGQPMTELNFKLYRQATNKIVGLSAVAETFLARRF